MRGFLADEEGITSEVFKLALAIIVVSAILAILASLLSGVRESGQQSVDNVGDALVNFSERIRNMTSDF
ncbi:MAG: hypothetical protein JXB14_00450 [Candidatus Altiarchaeota archaeon]|nr:hypothetical protein [Candidatus Altiarchaeota archaeon]